MDNNNQNFQQQPQQQQPQQQQFQQQPQQQFQQQPQMNNMYQQQFMAPQPPKFNLLELLSIICSGVGFLMAIIGTITTCSCSTSKSFLTESESFGVSLSWLIVLFAVIIAAAGIVLAIMALKQKGAAIKADKIAKLAFIVGVTAVVFGLLPLFTMCGYTCSLNSTIGSYR